MAELLVTVVDMATGQSAQVPYYHDDTVQSLLDFLVKDRFLNPSKAPLSVILQPQGRQILASERLITLSLGPNSRLDIHTGEVSPSSSPPPPIPNVSFPTHREPQTPCVLILDCSYSMGGKKINNLNGSLKTFAEHLQLNENTRRRVKILLITCGGSPKKISDWVDGADFKPPTLTAGGDTPLGQAVLLGLQEIETLKSEFKRSGRPYTRPVMILMTDGEPTDDGWEAAAETAKNAMLGKHVQVWPVPILSSESSTGSHIDTLRRFKPKDGPMITIYSPENFGYFFEFLERALEAASISGPGHNLEVPLVKDDPNSPKLGLST